VTVTRDGEVTGQNQNQSREVLHTSRKRDEIWDTFTRCLDYSPETKNERGKWNAAVKQLRDAGATPAELEQRISAYRKRWPEIAISPLAVANHWGELAGAPSSGNGRPQPPPVNELPPQPERDPATLERAKHLASTIGKAMP
jgi:hypothetical protein